LEAIWAASSNKMILKGLKVVLCALRLPAQSTSIMTNKERVRVNIGCINYLF
jgi:hypothetical protein